MRRLLKIAQKRCAIFAGHIVFNQISLALGITRFLTGLVDEHQQSDNQHLSVSADTAFHSVLDSVGCGVVVADASGTIVQLNRVAARLLGDEKHQKVGQNLKQIMSGPWPGDPVSESTAEENVAEGFKGISGLVGGEYELVLRRGCSPLPVSVTFEELIWAGEKYVLGTIQDFADRPQVAEKGDYLGLTRLQRMNALEEIASGFAHELNQPLSALSSYLSACQRRLENDEIDRGKIVDLLEKANNQAKRAGEAIRRVRSQIQHEESATEFVDVNALVSEVVSLLQADADRRGVTVRVAFSESPARAPGDGAQIRQALMHLVENAIDAVGGLESDARVVEIQIRLLSDVPLVEVGIRDFGPGVDDSISEELFEPFVTTKQGSAGIGLSISRTIVQAHGGTISMIGMNPGALFVVSLPASPEQANAG